MLDHVLITVPDLGAAARSCDAVMAALAGPAVGRGHRWIGYGGRAASAHPERCPVALYARPAPEPESRRQWCFEARDGAAVDGSWRAVLWTDDGGSGLRPGYRPRCYGAFLRDPAGNRVEAVCNGAPP